MEAAWQWRRAVWRSKVLKWALEGDENARQPELASVVERLRAAASDTPLFAPVAFELRGGCRVGELGRSQSAVRRLTSLLMPGRFSLRRRLTAAPRHLSPSAGLRICPINLVMCT